MKVWTCRQYGPPEVLRLEERPVPVPGPRDILVRVVTTSVSAADARVRGCRFPAGMRFAGRLALGWKGPRQPVLGTDCAGFVERVGRDVSRWKVGDSVIVVRGAAMGCHAEKVLAKADGVVVAKPERLGWAEAVSLPFGGQTARNFLQKAGLKPGDEVMVIGAAGAVGSAAVQLIARAGARAVAVTRGANRDWIRNLGAAQVLDREQGDFRAGTRRYDIVMDCVGVEGFAALRPLVKPGGAYVAVAGGLPEFLTWPRAGVRCLTGYTPESAEAIEALVSLTLAGDFRPVVGERFAFSDLPSAHVLADSGGKRGTAVVEVSSP